MKKHNWSGINYLPQASSSCKGVAGLGHSPRYSCLKLGAVVCWLAILAACSDDKAPHQQAEPPLSEATTETKAASATAPDEAASNAAAGSRYQVVAGTAYFFDSPEPTVKPNGKYLLRGDVLIGEEERNGFVRTRFKTPKGATVTGWLKREELGQLAATTPVRNTTAPARSAVTPPDPNDDYSYEEPIAPVEPEKPALPAATGTQRAVVQVARSYFYDSPDLIQPRKAHCVQGDKVWLGEVRGDAVYVTFTNWEKVTSRGWMRRDALRSIP
ncbi:hypothetical protein [Hymenobacter wooponensis]|uniref:Uncharacterized protein n=1 Tax=Hymenobacter wooponensis TaxID=1525360 RepID=A0A4Z0MT58_9BACT|nr:hypothetical protein [Hymenobacter wooponensis]TGD82476.1 hypothetical protein EU557_01435 [Hymenobacter wooponensis]